MSWKSRKVRAKCVKPASYLQEVGFVNEGNFQNRRKMSPWCWVGTQKKQFKLHHLGTSARITDSSTQYPLLQTTVSNLTGGEGSKDLLIRRTLSPLPEHPCPATPSSVSSIKPSFHFEGNQTLLMSSEKKKQKTNMPVTKERKKKKSFSFQQGLPEYVI